tara:strand:- start:168 stop:1124 length:957 start_codon:yes stop_codon:yes gene_type:complete
MANYNNGQYIQEAIESVILQSFSDWELLIMDDGSTDDSVSRIVEYLPDNRISLIRNSDNRGKVLSLLDLVTNSKAAIFGVLDSDDVLNKEALSIIYEQHIKHDDCGFIYSQFLFCDNNLDPICEGFCRLMPNGETNLRSIYSSAFRTFKKSSYNKTGGYDPKFIYGQDRDIVFKMEEVTGLFFIDKILYKHRVLSNSISNDPNKKLLSRILLIKAKYDAFCRRSNTQIPNLTKTEMSVELCIASVIFFYLKRRRDAIKYFKLAITLNRTLFFSVINYLFSKVISRINRLIFLRDNELSSIYSKINIEINRQLDEISFE